MSEFFAMGGYAAFVWPSYALTAAVMLGFLVAGRQSLRARRRALERLEAQLPSRRSRDRRDNPDPS